MLIDKKFLFTFAEGLVPQEPESSKIKATVPGFREISLYIQDMIKKHFNEVKNENRNF